MSWCGRCGAMGISFKDKFTYVIVDSKHECYRVLQNTYDSKSVAQDMINENGWKDVKVITTAEWITAWNSRFANIQITN